MNHPMAFLLACTCDRDRLRSDVEAIARSNHLMTVDCWVYLRDNSKHDWMRIVAQEEIERLNKSVANLCDRLAQLFAS